MLILAVMYRNNRANKAINSYLYCIAIF